MVQFGPMLQVKFSVIVQLELLFYFTAICCMPNHCAYEK